MIRNKGCYDLVIFFSSRNTKAVLLGPTTRERAKELEKSPGVERIKVDVGPVIDNKKFWK
jgi:hypothetical protein